MKRLTYNQELARNGLIAVVVFGAGLAVVLWWCWDALGRLLGGE